MWRGRAEGACVSFSVSSSDEVVGDDAGLPSSERERGRGGLWYSGDLVEYLEMVWRECEAERCVAVEFK
jgi:hypothetical protein